MAEELAPIVQFPDEFNGFWVLLCGHPKCSSHYSSDGALRLAKTLYFAALRDIPPSLLRAALIASVNRSEWFPTPASLRQMVEEMTGPKHVTAVEAWGAVIRRISSGGGELTPIEKTVVEGLGGLKTIGQCETKELGFLRSQFITTYEQIVNSERSSRAVPSHATNMARRAIDAAAPRVRLTDGITSETGDE